MESDTDKRKKRKCLRCDKLFNSAHAGNRICPSCDRRNNHAYQPPVSSATVYTDGGASSMSAEE